MQTWWFELVPPVRFDAVRRLAEAELGVPLERAYAWFDPTPLAAASLGQAHRALLAPVDAADMGYDEAVVKVQRPGIEVIVDVDLAALRRVAGWLSRVRFVANRVDLPSLVESSLRRASKRSTTCGRRATPSGSPRASQAT